MISRKKIKILHVLHGLNVGGAEAYIMNALEEIDDSKYQFDFLLRSNDIHNKYRNLLEEKKCKIHVTAPFPKKIIQNISEVRQIIKQEKYDVVHLHANALIYIIPMIIAKKFNVPIRIIHSHNSQSTNKFGEIIHKINKKIVSYFSTINLACSDLAGKWMFGQDDYEVVLNGINTENFSFSESKRVEMRKRINCTNEFIVGHVGRFEEQKNHRFLIDVFYEFHKVTPNSKLCLVGEGSLRKEIEEKVSNLSLQNKVVFLSKDEKVSDWYNAFDVFLMPSKYEGLAIVLVEAQTNGLKSLVSNSISHEVDITGNVVFEDLNTDVNKWVNKLEQISRKKNHRKKFQEVVEQSGYSTQKSVRRLEGIYNGEI